MARVRPTANTTNSRNKQIDSQDVAATWTGVGAGAGAGPEIHMTMKFRVVLFFTFE